MSDPKHVMGVNNIVLSSLGTYRLPFSGLAGLVIMIDLPHATKKVMKRKNLRIDSARVEVSMSKFWNYTHSCVVLMVYRHV